jgi:DNA-binding response OmpR family regulator
MASLLNDVAPAEAAAAQAAARASAAVPPPTQTVTLTPPNLDTLAGLDILIVDDEPQVGRVMVHAVEAWGCSSRLALSAAAFRAAYDEAAPNAVILDLSLPSGDGIEILRFLAERQAKAAVIIVSGCDARVVEAAGRLGGALGLRIAATLAKPAPVSELAAALAAAAAPPSPGSAHDLCL